MRWKAKRDMERLKEELGPRRNHESNVSYVEVVKNPLSYFIKNCKG